MSGTFEYIYIGIISVLLLKICASFYKNKNERSNITSKKYCGSTNSVSKSTIHIICDITNSFGKYYVANFSTQKYIVGIIPIYKSYNKEYEDVSNFNAFMANLFNFLNLRNGKVILASEDNCILNFIQNTIEINDENDEVLLASCIINNDKVSVVVCCINYEKEMDKLDLFLRDKERENYVVINNLFINNNINIKNENFEHIESLEKMPLTQECNDISNLPSFLNFFNVNKNCLNDFYSFMQINIKNYIYVYKLLGNNAYPETFLNIYIDNNHRNTKIYNSTIDICHVLISEAIKKNEKNIIMKKFYPFCCQNYNQMTKYAYMKLENNMSFYFYKTYFYLYYQITMLFSRND
ncbi:conserved Plasmodium protein, unknown function [Plasmodium berghei]|uniref:Uncharacterized protein n=2 Tax=Plasmodium berghei TaxID=5821 RepID=A0A509AK90_PLABA|nr:conserved Plasmodium protein, unknown function [Plasmodium berghei ANKA]CXI43617.1 conserved Plasmodium protein, unknown function [Plasmodium berghei]SCM22357.1 conserved Plasmodium protein, unknown function [Plasmodium berghei]SCN25396.1 conserved Plasmodium protein, unknown function [Plasmodium berghei]SCO60376.1 conserved Plasmodium protein, unknown function [Plasmodium berghei]SCO62128.1 conserved Plasmodium protein, unknown function [Plasmodium berghei]|eukprot:XP_034421610.1 conserved Plasmodium protein, unknown function [Plasmodium berghei ANKA]